MSFPYEGATAVVTGASSGLGRALAAALARRGAAVVAVARNEGALDRLVDALGAGTARLVCDVSDADTTAPGLDLLERRGPGLDLLERLVCDVSDADAWPAALEEVEARRGGVDLLVNAAGIERRKGAATVRWADVEDTMAVNFDAAARATLTVLPGMLDRGHGAVVNVSSDHGRAPGPGTPAYCASKAALSAFTESLAHEVAGSGVHLHVLYPGWVPTPLGQGAVDQGMPMPPKAVRRTEAEVVERTLAGIGGANFEINVARLATFAPVARALLPPVYRRSMRATGG